MKALIISIALFCIIHFTGCKDSIEKSSSQLQPKVDLESCEDLGVAVDEKEPTTLKEAVSILVAGLSEEDRKSIEDMESEDDMTHYHFGGGMGMRNGWGLWGDSSLALYMRDLGFTHADDMSAVILESLWCEIHKKPYRLEEKAEYYRIYWKEAQDPSETVKDPRDGSNIEWKGSMEAEGRLHRTIHVGKSVITGKWVVYEHTKGAYIPDPSNTELMKSLQTWDDDSW